MASLSYKWHHGSVHYTKRGLGDPLLLVHNIYPGASLEEYDRNITPLAKHFTVYALDLLGFGQSDAPRMRYTAQIYIELIFDFLREVVAKPAHVVSAGLSSAYVAEVAAWRSNLFRKLVFICPRSEPTGLDSPRWFAPIRHFFLSTPALGSGFHKAMASPSELKRYLRDCFYNPRAVTADLVNRLASNAKRPDAIYAYASLITGYLDWSILTPLPRIDLPVMIIWGQQARPTPVEHGTRLSAMTRHCRLEVIQNAGTWVHDEQSTAVNRLVTEYCQAD